MSKREPNFEEIATLRDVLIEALPNTCLDDLTDVAIGYAKAVRAAFEELTQEQIKSEQE